MAKPAKSAAVDSDHGEDAFKQLYLGKIQRAQDTVSSATGALRNVYKNAELKAQLNISAAKEAISIARSDEPETWVAKAKAIFEYLPMLGVEVDIDFEELALFAHKDARDGVAKAKRIGRQTALQGGKEGDCPYAATSPQGQKWLEAFRDGERERKIVESMDAKAGDQVLEKTKKKADAKAKKDAKTKEKAAEPDIKGPQPGEEEVDDESSGAPNPDAEQKAADDEFDAADPAKVTKFPGARSTARPETVKH